MKNRNCLNCDKLCYGLRCRECSFEFVKKEALKNEKPNYCINCIFRGIKTKISRNAKRCHSCASRKNWRKEEYRKENLKSQAKTKNIVPNKPERQLNKLLNRILPNEYKFVGDYKFWIEKYNPDFINVNGQKKIIEMFGDYWHNRKDVIRKDKLRLKSYSKHGYKTLIVWEHELKNCDKIKKKVINFHNF